MFNVEHVVQMLEAYAKTNCKQCAKVRSCVLANAVDNHTDCPHAVALLQVREYYTRVANFQRVAEGCFIMPVDKLATDGTTKLAFDKHDKFIIKGEFSYNQWLCKEKCPGGREFTLTKRTEGTIWERIL